jgi:hypothetical protein
VQVEVLTEEGADLGCKDKQGLTPLHFAAGRGYLGVVQFLWSKGAEVDAEAPGKHLRPAPGAPLPAPADRWFSALAASHPAADWLLPVRRWADTAAPGRPARPPRGCALLHPEGCLDRCVRRKGQYPAAPRGQVCM